MNGLSYTWLLNYMDYTKLYGVFASLGRCIFVFISLSLSVCVCGWVTFSPLSVRVAAWGSSFVSLFSSVVVAINVLLVVTIVLVVITVVFVG